MSTESLEGLIREIKSGGITDSTIKARIMKEKLNIFQISNDGKSIFYHLCIARKLDIISGVPAAVVMSHEATMGSLLSDMLAKGRYNEAYQQQLIEILLAKGVSAIRPDENGKAPLHHAKTAGVVKQLLAAGAKVDVADNKGNFPLHYAANGLVARGLLEAGADANAQNTLGRTALHDAIDAAVAEVLLENGANPGLPDKEGVTPMMAALSVWGNIDLFPKMLESSCAPVDCLDPEGNSLAMLAVRNKLPLETLQVMKKKGYKVSSDVVSRDGKTLLSLLLENDYLPWDANNNPEEHAEVVAWFKARVDECPNTIFRDGNSLPHLLVRAPVLLKHFLTKDGANLHINHKNEEGDSPLHGTQDLEVIKELLAAGADPNLSNAEGKTPLHRGAAYDYEVANALLGAGAKVDVRDAEGNTPLHLADSSVVDLLLKAGADLNAKNAKGETPLHRATDSWTVEKLLEAKADPNITDNEGKTPLHNAKDAEVIEKLLAADAKVDVADNAGKLPLHYAIGFGVAASLLKAGVNPNAPDAEGKPPLCYVKHPMETYAVWWLLEAGADPLIAYAFDKQWLELRVSYLNAQPNSPYHHSFPAAVREEAIRELMKHRTEVAKFVSYIMSSANKLVANGKASEATSKQYAQIISTIIEGVKSKGTEAVMDVFVEVLQGGDSALTELVLTSEEFKALPDKQKHSNTLFKAAVNRENYEALKWLREEASGFGGEQEFSKQRIELMRYAARNGKLEILDKLMSEAPVEDPTNLAIAAAEARQLGVLESYLM